MKDFVFLTGLPRTGSTLLSSILSQNPNIHAEGNSAVCQLMWDLHVSCYTTSSEQLTATNRFYTIHDLISSIPKIYYKNNKSQIIVDKCRSWTIEANVQLVKEHITNNPKFIVLIRPIEQIVASFVQLRMENNYQDELIGGMLDLGSEPLMRSFDGVVNVLKNHQENCLFITYDDIVLETKKTVDKIYNFCGWKKFNHNFEYIENKHPENDEVYGLLGHHHVRPKIEKRKIDIELPKEILSKCYMLNKLIGL